MSPFLAGKKLFIPCPCPTPSSSLTAWHVFLFFLCPGLRFLISHCLLDDLSGAGTMSNSS